MKRLLFSAITATSFFFILSCNKTNDKPLTPQQVDSVKIFGFDSTKLIKSLTYIYTDSPGNEIDSISEYFYYDTINKKIIAADQIITGSDPANYTYILSYNSSYRLCGYDIKERKRFGRMIVNKQIQGILVLFIITVILKRKQF